MPYTGLGYRQIIKSHSNLHAKSAFQRLLGSAQVKIFARPSGFSWSLDQEKAEDFLEHREGPGIQQQY